MFWWQERVEPEESRHGVEWAITDRVGGASQGPWAGLNLGAHVGDASVAVQTNRHRLARALGISQGALRFMDQQHGADVTRIARRSAGPPEPRSSSSVVPVCDALVTDDPEVVLITLVADCTPVLLVDRTEGLVAAVHAGRPGMLAGVVTAAVRALRDWGGSDLEAVVGPSICGRCYEVPSALREQAAEVSAVAPTVTWTGTPAIDVAAGVVEQLAAEGVSSRWLPGCARESPDLYSYRRDGTTGRYAGVVRLLAPTRVA